MRRCTSKFTTTMVIFTLSLSLVLVVACGGASSTRRHQQTNRNRRRRNSNLQSSKASGQQQVATKVPIAIVAPTPESPAAVVIEKPVGLLTSGQKELGPFIGHPNLAGNPQIYVMSTAPITESLFTVNSDLEVVPMLAREWEVSEDSLTWTFYLEEGVQFHKGYGEMVADDVIWSMQQFADSAKHPRASNIRGVFMAEDGHAKAIDDYTIEVNTGTPWSEVPINEMLTSPAGSATWIVSKRQTEELGAEEG